MSQPREAVRLHPPDKHPAAWVAEVSDFRQATFGGRKGNLIPMQRQESGGLVKQSPPSRQATFGGRKGNLIPIQRQASGGLVNRSPLPRQVRLCSRRENLRRPPDLPPIIAAECRFTVGESAFGGGEQTFGGVKHTLSKYKDNFIWHTVKLFSGKSHRLPARLPTGMQAIWTQVSDRHTVGMPADSKTGFGETVRYGAGGCASAARQAVPVCSG